MIEKLEQFLFDILGLVIPGFIAIFILFLLPILILDLNKISNFANDFFYLNLYIKNIISFYNSNKYIVVTLIILICYILGHVIKVMSKYPYALLNVIFDEGIFKILNNILEYIILEYIIKVIQKKTSSSKNKPNPLLYLLQPSYRKSWKIKIKKQKLHIWYIDILNFLISLYYSFFKKVFNDIFSFNAPNYYSANENIKKNVLDKLKNKYEVDFPDNWYSIYKISNVILSQENIYSLSFKFLAKYNFYRSLSFIFLANYIYILTLYNIFNEYISNLGKNIFSLLIIVNSLLWITFHEKFKRDWTLCGNESLMNLFYFLSKSNNIENSEVKNNE